MVQARILIAMLFLLALSGCARSGPSGVAPPTSVQYQIVEQYGGTFIRAAARAIGDDLEFLYLAGGHRLVTVTVTAPHPGVTDRPAIAVAEPLMLGTAGEDGPVVDMVELDRDLWIVLDRTALIVVDVSEPDRPHMRRRISAEQLGIEPQHIRTIDRRVYVSGIGGVIELTTSEHFTAGMEGSARFGPVAMTQDGPAVCVDRQIRTLRHGRYLGAADELVDITERRQNQRDAGSARWIAIMSVKDGTELALMSPQVRAVDRITLPDAVLRIRRARDGGAWVAGINAIKRYEVQDDRLTVARRLPFESVRDIVELPTRMSDGRARSAPRRLLVGDFGWRIESITAREVVEPGAIDGPLRIDSAGDYGRGVIIDSGDKQWTYRPGMPPQPRRTDNTGRGLTGAQSTFDAAPRRAALLDYELSITNEGRGLVLHRGLDNITIDPPDDAVMHVVVAASGRFFIGHDRGIWIARPIHGRSLLEWEQSLSLFGPVTHLFPQWRGEGVVFVSERGGVGLIEPGGSSRAGRRWHEGNTTGMKAGRHEGIEGTDANRSLHASMPQCLLLHASMP